MKIVIQRVSNASVSVDAKEISKIERGFMILVGVHQEDTQKDVDYLVRKVVGLRVFEDGDQKMNLNIQQVEGEILSISQFTLYAAYKKGNRPSFSEAAKSEQANSLYEAFNLGLKQAGIKVKKGCFGAHMQVSLVNDGPVTIVMDTRES